MDMNKTARPDGPVISVAGVSKRFDTTLALDDVTLAVPAGEVTVLLGLSGSGKSTLLRHVNGLEQPTAGAVEVLGQPVSSLSGRSLRTLRSRIGFIFQQFELVGSLTVLENVLTGSLASVRGPRLGLWSYSRTARLAALGHLDRVGLLGQAYQRADTLSGGQQQRVAIARALMQDPEILLADEPVASLDPDSSRQVMDLIREIGSERSLTVLCSLHQVDLAISWADRVVGLRQGRVVLDAATFEITKDEVMRIYGPAASAADIAALEAVVTEHRPGGPSRVKVGE
ncbi:phosphonate ABC transporter ATP-binding protein [Propionicicella superfundia]|uniref:phosphonate ABC transporter ATP-binding protein n=1 Tax=Propionicicella superfundia TaxID=348582 RepID=UPI00040056C3|nr:phosphonate ABC transporter ATP-binding protein [Propionicicella superfundia]